jgi:hypothetical protein
LLFKSQVTKDIFNSINDTRSFVEAVSLMNKIILKDFNHSNPNEVKILKAAMFARPYFLF